MKRDKMATVYREAVSVFSNQLFLEHPCMARYRLAVLVEEPRWFRDETAGIKFHKKKLPFHRASIRRLTQSGCAGMSTRSSTLVLHRFVNPVAWPFSSGKAKGTSGHGGIISGATLVRFKGAGKGIG